MVYVIHTKEYNLNLNFIMLTYKMNKYCIVYKMLMLVRLKVFKNLMKTNLYHIHIINVQIITQVFYAKSV